VSTTSVSFRCWGGKIRTSDWLIQSQPITPANRDLEFRSDLANFEYEEVGGQAR